MTDSHPPRGGQPDPNVNPRSGPAPQGRHPGDGQPRQAPRFEAPALPPQKPKRALVIGLAAAVVALLVLAGVGLALVDDDEQTPSATSGGPGADATPTPGGSESQEPGDNAVTARSDSDLGNVCEGSQILNAAPYDGPSGAKAYTFANSPDQPARWSSTSIPSNKPYYAGSTDFKSVSVVGCLEFVGGEGTPIECEYKDTLLKQFTIDYVSSRYKLTFYAAKTAEKIGDGGIVSTPANRCPNFLSQYNKNTMRVYASPDTDTIEAALDKLLS
ncbi:hypothetical protein AB0L34_09370 [Micromonospora sp. NPDC052213]|uniref:hypothetical protein n=1 Tax=Micromonospora sp. NPDC052213 TaxID=3155812 RepID=UPI003443138F